MLKKSSWQRNDGKGMVSLLGAAFIPLPEFPCLIFFQNTFGNSLRHARTKAHASGIGAPRCNKATAAARKTRHRHRIAERIACGRLAGNNQFALHLNFIPLFSPVIEPRLPVIRTGLGFVPETQCFS